MDFIHHLRKLLNCKKNKSDTYLNILRDIDLSEEQLNFVSHLVIQTTLITKDNYKKLAQFPQSGYPAVLYMYYCDVCKSCTNDKNAIYTNHDFKGVDVCEKCVEFTHKNCTPMTFDFNGVPVYCLSEILNSQHLSHTLGF